MVIAVGAHRHHRADGSSGDTRRQYTRVRIRRQRSIFERFFELVANPRLTRRQRNERLAIIFAVLAVGLYMIIAPIISRYFPASGPGKATTTQGPNKGPAAARPSNVMEKK